MQPSFKLRNFKCCSVSSLTGHRISKRLAKALIRLRVCAGWSESLLVAHTTLLEISSHGSFDEKINGQGYSLLLKRSFRTCDIPLKFSKLGLTSVAKLAAISGGRIQDLVMLHMKRHDMAK